MEVQQNEAFEIVLWNGKHKGRADTRNNWGTGVTVAKMHLNNAFFCLPLSSAPIHFEKESPRSVTACLENCLCLS